MGFQKSKGFGRAKCFLHLSHVTLSPSLSLSLSLSLFFFALSLYLIPPFHAQTLTPFQSQTLTIQSLSFFPCLVGIYFARFLGQRENPILSLAYLSFILPGLCVFWGALGF